MQMSNDTTATARRKPQLSGTDRIATASFVIILVLTNLWFFTQAMSYVR
jgi:hypothetical protein